jgi:imidazoleglycerol-phosphate dehydratase/histidinol-phosphatase
VSLKKILFLDRDGTLVKEPYDEQVDRLDKIELVENVIPALIRLKDFGYRFIMVSNQDALGSARYPQAAFDVVQSFILSLFASQGISFDEILICPHAAGEGCACRKPQTGLVQHYLGDMGWDRSRSYVIGDRDTDLTLARNMGITGYKLVQETQEGVWMWQDIADDIIKKPRKAEVTRKTNETAISAEVNLDAAAPVSIDTGIAFFDHMLEQIARHGGFSLKLSATGDLAVDDHHLVEDCGLVLGEALTRALGDKAGIGRYGFILPMDEALATAALDLSGRPFLSFSGSFARSEVGSMATEMVEHFFKSLTTTLKASLHLEVRGDNDHHKIEALFKAFGKLLASAVRRPEGSLSFAPPSTKGML